jgi:hypothetical protein
MAIQIGKYKRPGIFIEEFDNSVIVSPTVTGTTTFVSGFSKKGPVNTPVLLQTVNDLERIFGPLDRNLERKGSFFHRTVAKLLESNPVYAMNLLMTSDTLDTLEYKSLSTSSDKVNDIIRNGAYRRFFDTSSFWKKDTDSFITLTSNDSGEEDRLLSFTNMSDKYISVFIFKTKLTGYNRQLLEYYGSADKVPTYTNQQDYASDYMVDVIVVAGDWSNYSQLSVDSKWSQYFTTEGLDKTKINDFANDRNVNLLAYYEGLSMIPYFRDNNGRNIFIETIINNDTDRTGLFCAFNLDKFEKDYSTGMVDLIGNNLAIADGIVNNGQTTIDFLSYNATLVELLDYTATPLDIAGGSDGQNVVAFGPSISNLRPGSWGGTNRTANFSEELIAGIYYATASETVATMSLVFGYLLSSVAIATGLTSNAYVVTSGTKLLVNSDAAGTFTFSIAPSNYTLSSNTASYTSVTYIDATTGELKLASSTTNDTAPTIGTNDLVLNSFNFDIVNQTFVTASFTVNDIGVGVTAAPGFKELVVTTDYIVTALSPTKIKVTFQQTAQNDTVSDYETHRKIRLFNFLLTILDSANIIKVTMLKDMTTREKISLANATLSNVVLSTTSNKSFDLDFGTTVPVDILAGNLVFYKLDNELTLGSVGLETKTTVGSATGYGVAAKYSDLYTNFVDGQINTGDYFHLNLINPDPIRVVFQNEGTYSYVAFSATPGWNVVGNEQIFIPNSTLNAVAITLDGNFNYASLLTDPANGATSGVTYSVGYEAYRVTTDVTNEDLSNVTMVWDYTKKAYLKMYLNSSDNLTVQFTDSLLQTSEQINTIKDASFEVFTNKTNYKQTIEIEEPTGYTASVNKILVKGSRYTEIKVGDFLEAYVDPSIAIEPDQMTRNLTRILTKRLYAADTTLVEITCDAAIEKYAIGTDLQTMRYTTIEDYVTTYKAITLKGFRVREASMPDGTETRQNSILNLVAKGTQLFKAITNKETIDFRYVIDSFGLGLAERSKQQLVDISGQRLDCFGFINMPSMKSFKNSTSPSFVDGEGVLQTAYIAVGGNPESSPAFLYSFGDGRGVSTVGYFTPYVTVNDNGRPAEVPPAMYVANTYLRKLNSNNTSVLPWTVAAGVINGRVTNIAGTEMNFTEVDIENLNTAQMNPIVFKRNRGYVIETENTAQTLYKSALSYIHVREVLIELERELSAMLLEFQWKFNTPDVRSEIKLRADVICEKYVNKNGLYNYFNKCDEENNTSEIIDNQIGVLDTYVEPIKAMSVIVNNITILRTGAIQSGGFLTQ